MNQEGEQEFVAAGAAHSSGKPVRMNAALKILAKFLFDVARDTGAVDGPTLSEKAFKVVANERKEGVDFQFAVASGCPVGVA